METARMLGLCQRVADDIRMTVEQMCSDEGIPRFVMPHIVSLVHRQMALAQAVELHARKVEREASTD